MHSRLSLKLVKKRRLEGDEEKTITEWTSSPCGKLAENEVFHAPLIKSRTGEDIGWIRFSVVDTRCF